MIEEELAKSPVIRMAGSDGGTYEATADMASEMAAAARDEGVELKPFLKTKDAEGNVNVIFLNNFRLYLDVVQFCFGASHKSINRNAIQISKPSDIFDRYVTPSGLIMAVCVDTQAQIFRNLVLGFSCLFPIQFEIVCHDYTPFFIL